MKKTHIFKQGCISTIRESQKLKRNKSLQFTGFLENNVHHSKTQISHYTGLELFPFIRSQDVVSTGVHGRKLSL